MKKRYLNKKGFAIAALRRASLRWPPRGEAVKLARVGKNQYKCNVCGKLCTNSEKQLDHIEPVINELTGFTTFDEFIDRLYVDVEGWQILCPSCHLLKSNIENKKRVKKSSKKDKKDENME